MDIQTAAHSIVRDDLTAANAKLETAVKAALNEDRELRKSSLEVKADITKNEVTLLGSVESDAMHAKALELTKTAHAGVIINDKISVKSRKR